MTVGEDLSTDFLPSMQVYATPAMIKVMESVCQRFLKKHLGEDEDSVGTRVDVKHLAATPVGMKVTTKATLVEVNGRRCVFTVEAYDQEEKVGEGLHERFVINVPRFMTKVKQKASRIGPQ